MYQDLLLYVFITSLVTMGFYVATHKGAPLYFLRWGVDNWITNLEQERADLISAINQEEAQCDECISDANHFKGYFNNRRKSIEQIINKEIKFIETVFKPVFLCPRCMASVWSFIVFLPLAESVYGWNIAITSLIPAIFCGAIINSILFNHSDL